MYTFIIHTNTLKYISIRMYIYICTHTHITLMRSICAYSIGSHLKSCIDDVPNIVHSGHFRGFKPHQGFDLVPDRSSWSSWFSKHHDTIFHQRFPKKIWHFAGGKHMAKASIKQTHKYLWCFPKGWGLGILKVSWL